MENNFAEFNHAIIRSLKESYTITELADILRDMNGKSGTVGIHLFGLKFGKYLFDINLDDLCELAGIQGSYKVELTKMRKLYAEIRDHKFGVCFYEDFNFDKGSAYRTNNTDSLFCDITPVILYGPPGTGKTFALQRDYISKFDKKYVKFVTFHQSFSYEEFVEGLKPSLGDDENILYKIENGVFYEVCNQAAILAGYKSISDAVSQGEEDRKVKFGKAVEDKKFVLLCIDEINRGNVASIFGDLISLIEPSKRLGSKNELILTLPYSKQNFGVPANLLIVATMNTSDRSIQLLDSALRRRFRFEELAPMADCIRYERAKNVLQSINKRIRAILNKDAQIGHTFFIEVNSDEETLGVIAQKVIPLLEEYFYNDIDKIRFVLNDYGDDVKFYVEDKDAGDAYRQYIEVADIDSEEKNFYYIDPCLVSVDSLATISHDKASLFINQIIGA